MFFMMGITDGRKVFDLMPDNLTKVNIPGYSNSYKKCGHCGYETGEDFEFCPKCGTKF